MRAAGSDALPVRAEATIFRAMSTLAEIEQAADELPIPQVKQLIEHLAARLRREQAGKARSRTNLAEFSGALRLAEDPLAWQQRVRAEWQ